MSEQDFFKIIGGMSTAIVALALYVAALHKWKSKEASKNNERTQELLIEMIKTTAQSSSVIQNNSKVIEDNTRALNIVTYKR